MRDPDPRSSDDDFDDPSDDPSTRELRRVERDTRRALAPIEVTKPYRERFHPAPEPPEPAAEPEPPEEPEVVQPPAPPGRGRRAARAVRSDAPPVPTPKANAKQDWEWPTGDIPLVELNPPGATSPRRERRLKAPKPPMDAKAPKPLKVSKAPKPLHEPKVRKPDPAPKPARERRPIAGAEIGRVGGLALVGVALVAIGVLSYGAGHGADKPAAAKPVALSQRASGSKLALRYPASWTKRSLAPAIPGLRFSSPVVLTASGGDGLAAGIVKAATGSDLLPTTLRKQIKSVPPGEPVRLGELQALRYARVSVAGLDQPLTVYAVPTAGGSAIVACQGRSAAFLRLCERSAATLRVSGVRTFAIGPDGGYARRAAGALAAIRNALVADGPRLRDAGSAKRQAAVAAGLARTFADAAKQLDAGAVSARDRDGHDELLASIRASATAYGRLASAARNADRGAYADATGAVRSAAARMRAAVAALKVLGYTR